MSRSGEVSIDWGDGHYVFRLAWGQLVELQEKTDAGPFYILSRLGDENWRLEYIREVIRLGLIGGGVAPADAVRLVRTYVEDRPPLENILVARAIIAAALLGPPDETVGEAGAPNQRETTSQEKSSGSAPSTA